MLDNLITKDDSNDDDQLMMCTSMHNKNSSWLKWLLKSQSSHKSKNKIAELQKELLTNA